MSSEIIKVQDQVNTEILKSPHRNKPDDWFDTIALQRISQKEDNKETLLERYKLRQELISTLTIEEIQEIIFQRYQIDQRQKFHIEWLHILRFVRYVLTNQPIPETLSRYWSTDSSFFERLFIRIKCLQTGWSQENIEDCMERYYNIEVIPDKVSNYYYCLAKYLDIDLNEQKLKKGRPSFPPEVKSFIQKCINKKQVDEIKEIKQQAKILKSTLTVFDILQMQDMIKSTVVNNNSSVAFELMDKLDVLKSLLE